MRRVVTALLAVLPIAGLAPVAVASDPPPEPPVPQDRMFDPDFREGSPDDPLTKDASPLRRGQVDAFVDLFEAGYDVALTEQEEQELRDAVETGWPTWDASTRDVWRKRAAERTAVVEAARGDAAAARRLLDAFVADVDARLAVAPTAAHHAPLLSAKRRRDETFSAGSTPISASAWTSFEELALFLLRVARNEEAPVTDGQRLALREETRKSADRTGDAVRRHYARLPRLWRLVQARWESADDAGKLRMRWAAVRAFRWIVGLAASPEVGRGREGDLTAYAAAAREIAAKGAAFEQFTSAFQNPQALIAAAVDGMGMDPGDLEKAFAADPLLPR